MGRPRQFDRRKALTKALYVFWCKGYEATSMTDLQKALGIGRQSLYTTFGDKDALYVEALQLYITLTEQTIASRFDGTCGVEDIRVHLYEVIDRMTQPQPRTGCFVTNTCIELSAKGGRAAEMVSATLEMMTTCFTRALENSQNEGALRSHVNVPGAAYSLTLLNTGMLVMVKNGATAASLRAAVDNAIDGLVAE